MPWCREISDDYLKLLKGRASGAGSVADDVVDDVVDDVTDDVVDDIVDDIVEGSSNYFPMHKTSLWGQEKYVTEKGLNIVKEHLADEFADD